MIEKQITYVYVQSQSHSRVLRAFAERRRAAAWMRDYADEDVADLHARIQVLAEAREELDVAGHLRRVRIMKIPQHGGATELRIYGLGQLTLESDAIDALAALVEPGYELQGG